MAASPRAHNGARNGGTGDWGEREDDPTRVDLIAPRPSGVEAANEFGQYRLANEPYRRWPNAHLACRESPGEPRAVVLVRARSDLEMGSGLSPQALLARQLQHPNVVPVLDFVRDESELLVVVDYVVGETLARLQARGNRLPIPISVAIALGVLRALEAAHATSAPSGEPRVFGSITPESILVSENGVAQLLDVGLIEVGDSSCLSGSPAYVAPEHVFDQQVDARSDLFTVGLCLWESLTGRRLLQGTSFVDGMLRYISEGLSPASRINPDVSGALEQVLARAVDPTPARRFQSASAFAQALRQAARAASPAEVARYLEGIAWSSLEEQRACRSRVVESPELHEPETHEDSVPNGYGGGRSAIVTREPVPELDEPTRRVLPTPGFLFRKVQEIEDQTVRVLPAAGSRPLLPTLPGDSLGAQRAAEAVQLADVAAEEWRSAGSEELTAAEARGALLKTTLRANIPLPPPRSEFPSAGALARLLSVRTIDKPSEPSQPEPTLVEPVEAPRARSSLWLWVFVLVLLPSAALTGRFLESRFRVMGSLAQRWRAQSTHVQPAPVPAVVAAAPSAPPPAAAAPMVEKPPAAAPPVAAPLPRIDDAQVMAPLPVKASKSRAPARRRTNTGKSNTGAAARTTPDNASAASAAPQTSAPSSPPQPADVVLEETPSAPATSR